LVALLDSDSFPVQLHGYGFSLMAPCQGRVVYTGGYLLPDAPETPGATRLPADLENAAVEQIACWFQNRDKLGLKTIWPHYGTYQQFYPWDLLPGVQAILKKYMRWIL
jgi:hypothetical protein